MSLPAFSGAATLPTLTSTASLPTWPADPYAAPTIFGASYPAAGTSSFPGFPAFSTADATTTAPYTSPAALPFGYSFPAGASALPTTFPATSVTSFPTTFPTTFPNTFPTAPATTYPATFSTTLPTTTFPTTTFPTTFQTTAAFPSTFPTTTFPTSATTTYTSPASATPGYSFPPAVSSYPVTTLPTSAPSFSPAFYPSAYPSATHSAGYAVPTQARAVYPKPTSVAGGAAYYPAWGGSVYRSRTPYAYARPATAPRPQAPLVAGRSAPNENYTFKEVVNNLYAENIGSTASPWRANARPLYDDFITSFEAKTTWLNKF